MEKLDAACLDSLDDLDHKVEYTRKRVIVELVWVYLAVVPFFRVSPCLPRSDIMVFSAVSSPPSIKELTKKMLQYVENNSGELIGWFITVH